MFKEPISSSTDTGDHVHMSGDRKYQFRVENLLRLMIGPTPLPYNGSPTWLPWAEGH